MEVTDVVMGGDGAHGSCRGVEVVPASKMLHARGGGVTRVRGEASWAQVQFFS